MQTERQASERAERDNGRTILGHDLGRQGTSVRGFAGQFLPGVADRSQHLIEAVGRRWRALWQSKNRDLGRKVRRAVGHT